jgi:FixJ family two-component response regulator
LGLSWKEVILPGPWERPPPKQSRERICIVDDDEWVADSLKSLLETFGFEVQSCNSGTQLLADHQRRSMGCLIIDHHMPGINGLEIVERLQEEEIRLPTILISARLDTNTRARAANLGIAGVIEKPFAANHLIDLIRAALLEHD